VTGGNGLELKVDFSFLTGSSVLFDAAYIPGGDASVATLTGQPEASEFVSEAYKHFKAIAARGPVLNYCQDPWAQNSMRGKSHENNLRALSVAAMQR
jgi:hypothetical protein